MFEIMLSNISAHFPRTNELIVKHTNSIYWNPINQPIMTSRVTRVIAMAILSQLRLTSIKGPPGKQHDNMGRVASYRPITVGFLCILGMGFGVDTICKTKFARTSFYGYRCVTPTQVNITGISHHICISTSVSAALTAPSSTTIMWMLCAS